jgi:cytoskeletal protein RodZ
VASFGEVLRKERELRGIELREVADATKISVRFLQALENDRLDILPGGIFPRAFVRQYANYLGLDPDRMVNEFLYAVGEHPPAPPGGEPAVVRPRPGGPAPRKAPRALIAGLAAALAGAAGAWLALRAREPEPPEVAVTAPPPSSFAPDSVYPPPAASPTGPAAAVEGLVIGLTARQQCWVSVTADGNKVIDRVLAAGETQTVTARGEVVLSVGNAGGLAFTINGKPGIPLGRDGEVRRGVVITRDSMASLVQEPGAPTPGVG